MGPNQTIIYSQLRLHLNCGYMKDPKKEKIDPADFKFMEQNPYGDPDFSEEHNKQVIADVDSWNDMLMKRKDREFKEKIQERVGAVGQYLQNITQGSGVTEIERYFGRRYLAYLRGQQIVKQLQENPALLAKIRAKMEKQGKLQPL